MPDLLGYKALIQSLNKVKLPVTQYDLSPDNHLFLIHFQ